MKRFVVILLMLAVVLLWNGCEKHESPVAPSVEKATQNLAAPMPEIPAEIMATIRSELGLVPADELRLPKSDGPFFFLDLVGDVDNFHPGDPVDDQGLTDEGDEIVLCWGRGPEPEQPRLDELGVVDRPTSMAHFFHSRFFGFLPPESRIKAGVVLFRFKANRGDVRNDMILFLNPCAPEEELALPIIAVTLKDLLGGNAPGAGEVHAVFMNMRRAPIRKFSSYADFLSRLPAPGQPWLGGPDDADFNLLSYLYQHNPHFHSYMDMVFVDCDLTLDYSIFSGLASGD